MSIALEPLSHKVQRTAVGTMVDVALAHVRKDRQKAFAEMVDVAKQFYGDSFSEETYEHARAVLTDADSKWSKLINCVLDQTAPNVARTTALNLGYEAFFRGTKTIRENRTKYHCNIPWLILMDPTSACNLHCTGCWAAEYGHKLNLDLDTIDNIVKQGKKLGIYMYIYTGGEPLVRKKDLITLCERHPDCEFLSFTNGTLIDEAFCEELLRVKNFVPAISLEGFETANDGRRGEGVYGKVKHAMKLLKDHKLPFGISTCYTSANYQDITSEEFFDMMIEDGALFAWFFHYMPVGNDAVPELMPNPDQRETVYRRIREYRKTKSIFTMDFQNDAEFVHGCVAGGRYYLHINAAGDVDPCVFIHYSNCNIHEHTLEALKSPLFMAYHRAQPFNDNMFQPCPMLENSGRITELVKASGAKSTDPQSPESAEHLCGKTKAYAEAWAPRAEKLWKERQEEIAAKKAAQNK